MRYPQKRGQETISEFREYAQCPPLDHVLDLVGLGILVPGLGVNDGGMTCRGFDASGNTGVSGRGPAETSPGTPKLTENPGIRRFHSPEVIQNRKSFPDPVSVSRSVPKDAAPSKTAK